MICLTLAEARIGDALRHATLYRDYIDICELRLDYLDAEERMSAADFPTSLKAECNIADTILTVRRESDGGTYTGSEDDRTRWIIELLKEMEATIPFSHIDLEADIRGTKNEQDIRARAARRHITIIRSVHQFAPNSIRVGTLLEEVCDDPAEIGKVALTIRSVEELCLVIEQIREFRARKDNARRALIVIAMGEYGKALRILSKYFGFYCTYCSVPHRQAVAPGQLDPVELQDVYGYRATATIGALFAIVGNPVAHSQSPQFHNRLFRRRNIDARYLPIKCDSLAALRRLALLLPLKGFSVTIPHKEGIIDYLHSADDNVRMSGSCNTVIIEDEKWQGHNSDIEGFERPLWDAHVFHSVDNRDEHGAATVIRRALVVGAGGVARSVCYALLRQGYHICIVNRTPQRVEKLAAEIRAHYPQASITSLPLHKEYVSQMRAYGDLIVQTTSVGMHPAVTEDPIPFYSFEGRETVYDLIYYPRKTALLQRAEAAGCRVVIGQEMFNAQAKRQAEYFWAAAKR